MPTHQQFLAAIAQDPANPAPRLIYADWLEEQGDSMCHQWRIAFVQMRIVSDYYDWEMANTEPDLDGWGAGYDYEAVSGGGHGSGYGYGNYVGDGTGNGAGDHLGEFNCRSDYDPYNFVYNYGYGDFDDRADLDNGDGDGNGKRAGWSHSSGCGRFIYGRGCTGYPPEGNGDYSGGGGMPDYFDD